MDAVNQIAKSQHFTFSLFIIIRKILSLIMGNVQCTLFVLIILHAKSLKNILLPTSGLDA